MLNRPEAVDFSAVQGAVLPGGRGVGVTQDASAVACIWQLLL